VFGARNIAPVTYAAFAFVLGTTIGMVVRRTLPAMALTLLVFIAVQIAMPNLVRPHLMSQITVSKPMTAEAINDVRALGGLRNRPTVGGLRIPDAWVTHTSELLTADGQALDTSRFNDCIMSAPRRGGTGRFGDAALCLGDLNLHVTVSYQPDDRYWPFQWIESAIYLALSVLLASFAIWRLQRRPT
jgi:hypothetical protein